MDAFDIFVDARHALYCAQCGGAPDTRDHVPPRALLDQPYPAHLPVVGTCAACNEGASLDEEYLACLLEVAVCGTADPDRVERAKVARSLRHNPSLAARLAAAYDVERRAVAAEAERVTRVLAKIGRALWAFETGARAIANEASVWYAPYSTLGADAVSHFERVPPATMFAEVGSRMMIRQALAVTGPAVDSWQDVQAERFRYAVELSVQGSVRMVLRGYLAVIVAFT